MNFTYPHTIENCHGEKVVFKTIQKEYDGDRMVTENYIAPGRRLAMYTHWMQDKALKVMKGRLGYQLKGLPKQYVTENEIVFFPKGTAHRIWNAGEETLHCQGWLKPANTIAFFLTSFYEAQNKSGMAPLIQFDMAYLLKRYSTEYDLPAIPKIVMKTIIPVTYCLGKILRKYEHFRNAPEAIKPKKYYHNP